MKLYGYTRDSKGIVVNYHPIVVANTIHSFTGGGGGGQPTNLSHKPMKSEGLVMIAGSVSDSQDGIVVKQGGVSPCHTAGHGNQPKVLIPYETQ